MLVLSFCKLTLLVLHLHTVAPLPEIIKIGGLFDVSDEMKGNGKQETAFRYAVERINHNKDILPKTRLSAQIEKIPPRDSFHASKRVCHLLKSGVAALFGPESGSTSSHVQSICDAMEIPHIETRWDFLIKRDDYSINLYPSPKQISMAYLSLVKVFGWKHFTILYEDSSGLMRLQELLKSPTETDIKIVVKQLNFQDGNKEILREVKQSGEIHIVLDCSHLRVQSLLKEAQVVGMMTAYHNYLITNLDLHLVNLEDFKYSGTNITSFRLVDPSNPVVQSVVQTWMLGEKRFPGRNFPENILIKEDIEMSMKTETALMYDAVHLFAKALDELDQSQVITTKPLSCHGMETWQHGNSLVNYMKLVEMAGLTGRIKFDSRGLRTDFELEIVELKKDGLQKVGVWHDQFGIQFSRNFTETYSEIVESLQNKTLIVTTIRSPPYSMYKESAERLVGNEAFEGWMMEHMDIRISCLEFNYTFKWVDDGAYGYKNKETGEWNGLMGELLSQKADLAIADLTITYEREQAVDFSMPFMNLGISILYKKPQKQPPELFSFMQPLSVDVWIYMIFAYLGVSLLLFILARFSPYEWDNPHPCIEEPEVLVNEFSLCNSMWFTIGSLMQQGSDISPKSVSTRMVAGMWWFFTLIMISSYTANLAAFLTVERMESPIESADDLAKQTKIKYGCLESGSTRAFFRDSKIPTYSRMASFMESQKPSVFTKSNNEGVNRVVSSDETYAFLMESNSIQYQIERNCDLIQVGGLLDSKGYGIAFTPGSPYRIPISSAILQLQEAGRLHVLKNRWWKQRRGGGKCDMALKKDTANELSLDSVGGVFVILIAGMGIACLISVLEFCWKSGRVESKVNVKHSALVVQALSHTNSNMFKIAGIHQEAAICNHSQNDESWPQVLEEKKTKIKSISQAVTALDALGYRRNMRGLPDKDSTTVRKRNPLVPNDNRLSRSKQSVLHETNTNKNDPYGPMSGSNLICYSDQGRNQDLDLDLDPEDSSESESYKFTKPEGCYRHTRGRSHDDLRGLKSADDCGPLSSHSYCDLHCSNRHITYSSNRKLFDSFDC
ncbi:glutamate receptor ionotropic, kainate 2 [Eurytemora carolleeae]|uniref:glutamate receptor ionotropic, kainate 2 n=1 Tax=Eurytemora carolleeae TaxID=1294199 RepID=UPI000C78074D|nr:glutamate receptor ionotropic, kainate 2 [Eurytemora carolleeae]|eukprot:XP_023339114.1 glutamate receptor ionotropic, kainate 2-like [Eurytemora affinis]